METSLFRISRFDRSVRVGFPFSRSSQNLKKTHNFRIESKAEKGTNLSSESIADDDVENGAMQNGSLLNSVNVTKGKTISDTSFEDIMSFDGPGPERINGRLAMLGVIWGLIMESESHIPFWLQISEPSENGIFWFSVTTNVVIIASLIPLLRGEDPERYRGFFSDKAEIINSRVAMLGMVGIVILENLASSSLL